MGRRIYQTIEVGRNFEMWMILIGVVLIYQPMVKRLETLLFLSVHLGGSIFIMPKLLIY